MVFILRRQIRRIIAIRCIRIQNTIIVKTRWPNSDASFKIIFYTNTNRGNMPVLIIGILKSCSMSGTACKTSWLIRKRIVGLVFKWSEWIVAHINTISISTKLRSRCAILQIIFIVVLGHKSTFGKRLQKGIVVVFPKAFPTVFVIIQS